MNWSGFLNGSSLSGLIAVSSAFLNSSFMAAFIGAFSAFMLVVLNDRRRDRRTLRTIQNEIRLNRELAKSKREDLEKSYAALVEKSLVLTAPVIRFKPDPIRQLAPRVLHTFLADQLRSLDSICYKMEATDRFLSEIQAVSLEHRGKLSGEKCEAVSHQLLSLYDEGILKLGEIIEFCDFYIAGDYRTIVGKYYHLDH